jgi:hypothetical protein
MAVLLPRVAVLVLLALLPGPQPPDASCVQRDMYSAISSLEAPMANAAKQSREGQSVMFPVTHSTIIAHWTDQPNNQPNSWSLHVALPVPNSGTVVG